MPIDVANPEGCCFADTSARVIEKQQQCIVAPTLRSFTVGRGKKRIQWKGATPPDLGALSRALWESK